VPKWHSRTPLADKGVTAGPGPRLQPLVFLARDHGPTLAVPQAVQRILIYLFVVVAVAVPGALLASALVETPEDELESIIAGLERDRVDSLVDHGAFAQGGLVVSAGSDVRTFDDSQREAAREALDALTGIGAADRVRVRQREVRMSGGRAEAVVSLELDEGTFVALGLRVVHESDGWVIERVRVMS